MVMPLMGNSVVAAVRKSSSPRWIVWWGSLLASLVFLLMVARRRLHGIARGTIGSVSEFDDDSSNLSPSQLRYQALCAPKSVDVGWEFAGPTGYVNVWNEGGLPAAAAVQNLVVAGDSFFLSSVNGGIWRTLRQSDPLHWENVLDGQQGVTCTSISALTIGSNSIYAGCGGATSSEQGYDHNVLNTGDWGGVMVSSKLGQRSTESSEGSMTWTMLEAFPPNYFVTDLLEIAVPNGDEVFLLVAAQSHLYNATDGGIWRVPVVGNAAYEYERVSWNPTFTLSHLANGAILATHGHATTTNSVSISWDHGNTFSDYGRLPWNRGYVPFYTCAAEMTNGRLVVAGLTRQTGGLPNATDSQFFVRNENGTWSGLSSPPTRMDQDSMPKDRMALLSDPELDHILYVAGNAESLAWRVDMDSGIWTPLWDTPDVLDGSVPHADCRNFAWDDSDGGRLLLVTDGGVYARVRPREAGGKWISLNGDYSALELLSAHYDPQYDRYVMGAQDNCALFTKRNATPSDTAFGFVEGDGTTTLVDSSAGHPSRIFGTVQFLGVMGDNERDSAAVHGVQDSNMTCGGLCFLQGEDTFVEVDAEKYFPEPSTFPFFDHPYALNRQDPTRLHFWTNGTGPERPSAIYEFHIPYSVQEKDDIGPPSVVIETPPGAMILQFVSGGYTAGEADPDLLVAMSSTHLYVRNRFGLGLVAHPLPVGFADPVTLQYDTDGKRILGPLTHARTVSMSVLASDSRIVVVTGWQTVRENSNDEDVYITRNAGKTWQNITGNLRAASGVSGKVRPGGALILGLPNGGQAVLVGSSNGLMVAFLPTNNPHWIRLGTCAEFPIVLTADVSYESATDRLVAATFGRGIYVLKHAMSKLIDLRQNTMDRTQP